MNLTPEKIEKARQMRANNEGWDAIACKLSVSRFKLRCEIDPGYREIKRANNRRQRAGLAPRRGPYQTARVKLARKYQPFSCGHIVDVEDRAPDHVIAEREQRLSLAPMSLTAAIMGDPVPGRSALDRKTASA